MLLLSGLEEERVLPSEAILPVSTLVTMSSEWARHPGLPYDKESQGLFQMNLIQEVPTIALFLFLLRILFALNLLIY